MMSAGWIPPWAPGSHRAPTLPAGQEAIVAAHSSPSSRRRRSASRASARPSARPSAQPSARPSAHPSARPSLADVARRAGVSVGTVSHVLNHPERVVAATRERVLAAVEELEYRPNRLARSLAGGRSQTIGLALTDLGNSLFVDIARGAGRYAEEHGMQTLLADGDNQLGRELGHVATFEELRVAGVLVTLSDDEAMATVTSSRRSDTPLVLLNFSTPAAFFCSVAVDNVHGGRIAAEHLLAQGRRRLAFVGGPEVLRPVHDRRSGFRHALADAGLGAVLELTPEGVNEEQGRAAAEQLLPRLRSGEVDGIVAASDLLAVGLLEVLLPAGIAVPGDVGIVGYDDNLAAHDAAIPLTTVAQTGSRMGTEGARLVIAEATEGAEHQHEAVLLTPSLVVRSSSQA